ncbi:MAG: hypothetical protein INR69_18000 [Mucilaginibacter polytrichastri]|nr:hypothetical protein [Mucilaginibacter polytrichastri]
MRNFWFWLLPMVFLLPAGRLYAQHEHHKKEQVKKDTTAMHDHAHMQMDHDTMPAMDHSMHQMSHAYSRNLPMTRNGSGTGWLPDASPMYAYMTSAGKWNLMLHAALFPRYTTQNFTNKNSYGRGDKFDMPNWFMGMAQKKIGKRGLFNFTAMISLDPLTEGGSGYPLLFQTGETYKNQPLVNRQHPHDLISALAVGYTHAFSKDVDLSGYFGYPGEPALGPVAFMHRPSAINMPDATLGHHWQDATHILFGVATLGFRYKIVKLEGSVFTGREPDEHRYDFDRMRFDSYSYRVSVNPNRNLALQFSQGFLNSPEISHPNEDVTRTTASVIHQYNITDTRFISTSLIYGLNTLKHDGERNNEHSFTAETNFQLDKTGVYGRYEFVQKSTEEIALENVGLPQSLYNVNALTVGANRRIAKFAKTDLSIGVQASLNFIPADLERIYGSTPLNGQVYLKINPSLMRMKM